MTDLITRLRSNEDKALEEVAAEKDKEIERLKAECAEQRRLKEGYYNEAADSWAAAAKKNREIERLKAEVIRLRAGLEKIAAEPSIAAAIRGTND